MYVCIYVEKEARARDGAPSLSGSFIREHLGASTQGSFYRPRKRKRNLRTGCPTSGHHRQAREPRKNAVETEEEAWCKEEEEEEDVNISFFLSFFFSFSLFLHPSSYLSLDLKSFPNEIASRPSNERIRFSFLLLFLFRHLRANDAALLTTANPALSFPRL
jgi:hypothetical protein